MQSMPITEDRILNALRGLDQARWFEVLDFIGYLKQSPLSKTVAPPLTARELLESDLVGIWADRGDIGDTLDFARYLRTQAEQRLRTE